MMKLPLSFEVPMQRLIEKIPRWLVLVIALLQVMLLGYLDYLTGDYSLLIFYVIPIAFTAWSLKDAATVVVSLASGVARFVSDYGYSPLHVKYWNSLQDTAFLIMVGLLLCLVKRLLSEERS